MIPKALTIAGSDSGGGAGIQADLKTFQELNVFGMSAITALTAQNTRGVQGVFPASNECVRQQLDSIAEDLKPQAIKTGMLYRSSIIQTVAEKIKTYGWSNVVVDPVMIAKGGASLLQKEAIETLKTNLIPLSTVITPNIPEAEVLTGMKIKSNADRKQAAEMLLVLGCRSVVIKGGHHEDNLEAIDLFFDGNDFVWLRGQWIQTRNTHGTGCTFSSAITAELAKGENVLNAIRTAKSFIQAAIEHELNIGSGHGPTNHWAFQTYRMGRP